MTRVAALLGLALLAGPASADILLQGSQHIGDRESAGSSFDPDDPVSRQQMQAKPSHFHLSQAVVITAVRLENADDLDGRLRVFIDNMSTALPGTLSGNTYTLTSPLPLGAGVHTIWPDGGCSAGGFALPCVFGGENDFGFSAIRLVSSQITFSRAFTRRTHLGVDSEGDDDYLGSWYPDAGDGNTRSFAFTVEASRSLTEIRFYGMRDISASSSGPRVRIDGTLVGTVGANGDPPPLTPNLALAAGPHTLTVEVGQHGNGSNDDVSWDDIVLVMINNPSTTPGQFNAVDPGADAAAGAITTKVAGTPFTLDLAAVTGGAQFTAYTGTLAVELVDASNAAGSCATWPAVANVGNVTFTAADNGRRTATFSYAEALPDARVRMTDSALVLSSCSVDNFAIRPHTFGNLVVSHADAATAGTTEALDTTAPFSAATTPVHRAGRPFTVQATAYNSAGAVTQNYAGEPTITATASLLGSVAGTAAASGWTYPSAGSVRSDSVTYDEAGAAQLALVDSSFAAVDADDTDAATRATTAVSFAVGRFIPDHFTFQSVTDGELAPACAGGAFTYVGQAFGFATGNVPSARITAVAFGGTATRNYTDPGLYRLVLHASGSALPVSAYAAAAGTFDTSVIPDPDNSLVNEGNGKSLLTLVPPAGGYRFARGAPELPFDAEITITPSVTDLDGVTFEAANPGRFGDPATGGIAFTGDANLMRFGRVVVQNAHGSERRSLAVPLRAEFWNNGFQANGLDSCTALALSDVTLTTALATTPSLSGWTLTLSAPNAPGQVTIDLNAPLWLRTDDADADTTYDDNPRGVATFGLANDRQRRIYQREVVGY